MITARMFGSSTPAYAPLPADGTSPRHTPPTRTSRNIRRATIISLLVLALIVGLGGYDASRPESHTKALLAQTGLVKPDLGLGPVSQHRELVSVVLMVGGNDHGIVDVMRAVLAMTVGPYELIGELKVDKSDAGVFTEPKDQSQRISAILAQHHLDARVDRLGRGLTRYKAINATSGAISLGISQAKGKHIAILNANDQVVGFFAD